MRILLSWIGAQDPWIGTGGRTAGKLQRFTQLRPDGAADGPILSFLDHSERFDILYLLSSPAIAETGAVDAIRQELITRHPALNVLFRHVPIDDPRCYDLLYHHVRAICQEAADSHGPEADYNILLSPGTPQMHAIWVLLCKTWFPGYTPWQGSDQPGRSRAEVVHIPFNIEADIIEPTRREATATPPDLGSTGYIYQSEKTGQMLERLLRAARRTDLPILILGERGTGKELLARIAHERSQRANGPFVALNCGGLPEQLADNELFGHKRGAFTGADRDRPGLFEAAQGGTIFLDEIGNLALGTQAKLLRVLQEKHVRRLGANSEIVVDFRLVAATNCDVRAMVAEGQFQADLYDRLNGVTIQVPPLRERPDDIAPLIDHFLKLANEKTTPQKMRRVRLAPGARASLLRHTWPGNVRELGFTIERLAAISDNQTINSKDIEDALSQSPASLWTLSGIDANLRPGRTIDDVLVDVEKDLLRQAKDKYQTQTRIGSALGITQQAVSGRKKRLGLH
jgi:DNA-binding NtrC family response regulator